MEPVEDTIFFSWVKVNLLQILYKRKRKKKIPKGSINIGLSWKQLTKLPCGLMFWNLPFRDSFIFYIFKFLSAYVTKQLLNHHLKYDCESKILIIFYTKSSLYSASCYWRINVNFKTILMFKPNVYVSQPFFNKACQSQQLQKKIVRMKPFANSSVMRSI